MYTQVLMLLLVFTSSLLSSGSANCPPENSDFVSAYPQCANNPGLNAQFDSFLRDLVCDATCGPPYLAGIRTCFSFRRVADYYEVQCRVNANGMPCYNFYVNSSIDRSVFNPEAAFQVCNSSILSNTCSDECREQLTIANTHWGSCVNSLTNSSYFHSFNYELLPLFSYQLWTACGVPTPGEGSIIVAVTTSVEGAPTTLVVDRTTTMSVDEATTLAGTTTVSVDETTVDGEPATVGRTTTVDRAPTTLIINGSSTPTVVDEAPTSGMPATLSQVSRVLTSIMFSSCILVVLAL